MGVRLGRTWVYGSYLLCSVHRGNDPLRESATDPGILRSANASVRLVNATGPMSFSCAYLVGAPCARANDPQRKNRDMLETARGNGQPG